MIKTELFTSLNEPRWDKSLPEVEALSQIVVENCVNFINDKEPQDFFAMNVPLSFNLCLSNDNEVHALNKEFRRQDKPTNVLSFANIDSPDFFEQVASSSLIEMGDIIIALETMTREAEIKHITLHDHFCHLLTHGVLHLLGYDHIEDKQAEHMESLEIEILKQLNINNPYEE